ncbi:G-protein coupled receptor 20-like [Poecilia reticulata]|uniref:G-protein coupled receptor 20-like n=1 Tax=Poecilia reticulata TaxID=8081 RepID=UPI0007E96946|nr:PREDICTED: G-protein coupled receptor 20-like [Poecilia reticulata]
MSFPRPRYNYPDEDFEVYPEYLDVMIWINIHVCLPFTFLVIALCCTVRLDHIPATYYVNLLVSNLIQIITLIVFLQMMRFGPHRLSAFFISYIRSGMASFSFRMIFALERFLYMSKPQCLFIRRCKGFVTVSICGWIFSGVLVFLLTAFYRDLLQICLLLLAALVTTILLAVTLRSLCKSSSMRVKEKCRNIGILVLMLVNYIVTIFPTCAYFIYLHLYLYQNMNRYYGQMESSLITEIIFTLSLLSPVMDLIVFAFMSKGPFIKLLMRLCCCCSKETAAANDSSSSSV